MHIRNIGANIEKLVQISNILSTCFISNIEKLVQISEMVHKQGQLGILPHKGVREAQGINKTSSDIPRQFIG